MRRVVVTGIGIIAPNGQNKETFWQNCYAGKSYVISDEEMKKENLKSHVLCRIQDFDITKHISLDHYPDLLSLDKFVQYGVCGIEQAAHDSNILPDDYYNKEDIGVIFSSAIGGTPTIVDIFGEITHHGEVDLHHQNVGERFYNSGMFNYPACLAAERLGFCGPCTSVTTGCTAGLDALGMSFDIIRSGDAKVMIAGASEAPLTMLTYATLDVINSLSITDCEPAKASRPFDAKRSGFVISEGAAVLVLEELESAIARGAHIYAEVKSFGSVSNAFHMTDLPESGVPMAAAIQQAIDKANVDPKLIDYINAHGSSTPQNDIFETSAYKAIFKDHAKDLAISSVKSMIGHSLSSASLMGAICVLGAIENSKIHPTINYQYPDPMCDLDYVPNTAREREVNYGMVTASGFGGIHSCAIFQKMVAN